MLSERPDMPQGSRELLLMRNGKAEAKPPRELKDRGKRQAQRVGVWLAGQGLLPDHVLCMKSARARVTAQKALKAGGASAREIDVQPELGSSATGDILELLGAVPQDARRVLVVAHRGALERLAAHLVGRSKIPFASGQLWRLRMPENWATLAPGSGEVLETVLPDDLPKRFPFPGPGGCEWRDRPAYYYRQSAVVPWRVRDGRLEILVITSSKRNHWVVPKGIHEPGLSAQDSAAQEAEEEAGVLGEVGAEPLGRFELEKWGGTCSVEVYPMRVTRVIDDADWDESHRSRLWVTPEVAREHLRYPMLGAIIAGFAAGFEKD